MNTHASHKTVGTLRLYLEVVRGRGRGLDAWKEKTTQRSGQSPLKFPPFVSVRGARSYAMYASPWRAWRPTTVSKIVLPVNDSPGSFEKVLMV